MIQRTFRGISENPRRRRLGTTGSAIARGSSPRGRSWQISTYGWARRFVDERLSSRHLGPVRRVSGGTVRFCSESRMSSLSLLTLVSALFALTTHHMAAFRYEGGCFWKNSHAFLFARNCRLSAASNSGASLCSYE